MDRHGDNRLRLLNGRDPQLLVLGAKRVIRHRIAELDHRPDITGV